MFGINQKVVYPGHGVAIVQRILEKSLAGKIAYFYELKFVHKDMTILVPVDNIASVGVRELSSIQQVTLVYGFLRAPAVKISQQDLTASSWNKRSKKYQFLLRTGDIFEIAKIYKDLSFIASFKELSFGERALLAQTEGLLVQEIAFVENRAEQDVAEQIRTSCLAAPHMPQPRQATI